MYFATIMQQLDFVKAQFRAQDETGTAPSQIDQTASRDDQRAAMLAGARPACGCDPANGPVPCDAAILAVLSSEPITGCPNVSNRG
jgi:hypothetical protein